MRYGSANSKTVSATCLLAALLALQACGGGGGGGGSGSGGSGGSGSGGSGGSGSGGSGSSASACFDPTYGTVGTVIVGKYKSTDSTTGAVVTTDYTQTIGNDTFNGMSLLSAAGPVTTSGASSSSSTATSYFQINSAAKQIIVYGVKTVITSPISATTTLTFSPNRTDRNDLNAGESYTQTYTVKTSISGSPVSIPDSTQTIKRTYLGQESVTVAAGTFSACKFTEEATVSGTTSTTTLWNFKDGITLKSVSGSTTNELISATVNGTAIK